MAIIQTDIVVRRLATEETNIFRTINSIQQNFI